MKGFVYLLAAFVITVTSLPAGAQEGSLLKAYLGANALWYDGPAGLPGDFEVGGNARASLSPHISAVGAVYYGFDHSYLRGSAGARFTATNPDDPNFSVGVGIQYHVSGEPEIRPEEWAPDVTVGWLPWPGAPQWILVGLASYGLKSNQASALAGLRYEVWRSAQ